MAPSDISEDDRRWMAAALTLAARGLGRVAPNPAVGCILVKDGFAVGRGWTQPGGRPHAETEALRRAGAAAKGSTAYVTLEPCSHTGKTGPCADALIAAGVSRAVVAMEDPDERVSGRGVAKLRDAGITVSLGVMSDEAARLNRGFLLNRTEKRPLVTLKLATSLDGRIATTSGESKWITGPDARNDAHLLRMDHDAVLVGIGTALADDPSLTCRLPGTQMGEGARIVLDTKGRLPATARFCDGAMESLQVVGTDCQAPAINSVVRIEVQENVDGPGLSIPDVLTALAEHGITRLMVEGGGETAASFLRAGLVDRVQWYRAPLVLGGDGIPCIGALEIEALASAGRFFTRDSRQIGADRVDRLECVE